MAPTSLPESLAVLYLRMSSDDQEDSIPSQRAELLKFAKRHGYTIVDEYLDEAISGDNTERRTGFLKMRDDVDSGKFSVVLCWDQDRFGRFDPLDAGYWIYPFRQADVRLETIAQGRIDWENLTGQLIYSVNQLGKAQFLRDLSRNTTRGLLASARLGTAGTGGPSPYGYRSKDGVVVVVEVEAEVVRWIFVEYLKPGSSLRGLAAKLNRRKITPPRGTAWRCSSIRTILQRRKYTGSFVFGFQNAGKYFAMRDGEVAPRRKSDKKIASAPVVHRDRFEAIVTPKTFDRVQAKLAGRRGNTTRKTARKYLPAGLVKCGDCGGSMGGLSKRQAAVYHCRQYHATGTASCFPNSINEAPLVACIVRKIQERYLSVAALARLRRALEAAQDGSKPRPKDLARLRREIEALDRKIDQGAERALEAPAEIVPALFKKLEEFRVERERIKTDLDALTSQEARPDRKDGSEIDEAIEALRDLGEALKDADPEETRNLLGSLVSRIELHFDHEQTSGGRHRSVFSHGTIFVRPDAGEGRAVDHDSPHLNTTGSLSDVSHLGHTFVGNTHRFDATDTRNKRSLTVRDALACPPCGGQMKMIALIEPPQGEVIEKILRHCGLQPFVSGVSMWTPISRRVVATHGSRLC